VAERIPQHKHCTQCGKAVPVSERFCSDNCKGLWDGMVKKRMLQYRLYLLSAAAIIFLLFFGSYL